MRYLIFFLVVSGLSPSFAQKAINEFSFHVSPQWFYLNNSGSVRHIGNSSDFDQQQVLYPSNTIGYNAGLSFQHIRKYGLILGLELQTGLQKHEVGVHYDLGYVDRRVPELKNVLVDTQYKASVRYAALMFTAGYRWFAPVKALKGWNMDMKVGIAIRHNFNSRSNDFRREVGYSADGTTFFITPVSYEGYQFAHAAPLARQFYLNYTCYIGINKEMSIGPVRSLSVGLEAVYRGTNGYVYTDLFYMDNNNKSHYYRNAYAPKNIGLGLRLALGLWL